MKRMRRAAKRKTLFIGLTRYAERGALSSDVPTIEWAQHAVMRIAAAEAAGSRARSIL